MEITAAMVKELREKTGAGILDAKKALVENDGDMEKAMEYLRQKGIASADKKMGRIAAEGVIASVIDGNVGAMVEVNCETDFVAKNEDFISAVNSIVNVIAKQNPVDVEALNKETVEGATVEDFIKEKIAKIGEKITIRRFARYEGKVASYVHNKKIGVLLSYEGDDKEMAEDICLHITSNAPEFISRKEIPQSVIDEETRIEMGKEDLANKPDNIKEKIVTGRVDKLMASKCLMEQPFVKNPDVTIEKLIEGKLTIKGFTRFALGEGLEKRQDNFAEEVMNQIKG